MAPKPLRRDENIAILSRDHHFGLLFCWKIRQGIKKNVAAERIKNYISYYWHTHLQTHFEEEEIYMFLKVNDDACRKALQQHEQIRELMKQILTDADSTADYSLPTGLADLVEAHIRFEERELFPHLEEVLTEGELKRIGAALEQSHAVPNPDNYPDEFWTSK
ncbi:hemerythrin domain-containing protein [Rhodocytophaga rosea]|uniref:Hemerythrin domain-containing protein n=1 Tax=Rhodocytophaga rosea TaxID=2704465 RepID=A0A6C0GGF8_9BACT|nr:hemerythrin domain-containing protein [Rhodocytophaga rosea]QHT66965.1 hemerythrin domain-containing protein [Rhodocytophaga rosea]